MTPQEMCAHIRAVMMKFFWEGHLVPLHLSKEKWEMVPVGKEFGWRIREFALGIPSQEVFQLETAVAKERQQDIYAGRTQLAQNHFLYRYGWWLSLKKTLERWKKVSAPSEMTREAALTFQTLRNIGRRSQRNPPKVFFSPIGQGPTFLRTGSGELDEFLQKHGTGIPKGRLTLFSIDKDEDPLGDGVFAPLLRSLGRHNEVTVVDTLLNRKNKIPGCRFLPKTDNFWRDLDFQSEGVCWIRGPVPYAGIACMRRIWEIWGNRTTFVVSGNNHSSSSLHMSSLTFGVTHAYSSGNGPEISVRKNVFGPNLLSTMLLLRIGADEN